MFKLLKNRGIALFLTLSVVLFVVIMANIILRISSSQSRLTHHKVSRIQAYYASLAGVNFALDNLRKGGAGAWTVPSNHSICNTNPDCGFGASTCDVDDANFPCSVKRVNIALATPAASPTDPAGVRARIIATADYSY